MLSMAARAMRVFMCFDGWLDVDRSVGFLMFVWFCKLVILCFVVLMCVWLLLFCF